MTTKQHIIAEIQRLAAARGGRIGIRAFCSETEIPEHQILGVHWARWNDALTEAGVGTGSFFQPRTEDASVVEAFALLVHKLNKWPTQSDLQMERRRNGSFPSIRVIRRVRRASPFASRVLSYCAGRADLADVATIATEVAKAESAEAPVLDSASIVGYVYMMRSGRRYKIGHPTHRRVVIVRSDSISPIQRRWCIQSRQMTLLVSRHTGTGDFNPSACGTPNSLTSRQVMLQHSDVGNE